jgi:hypothetical protein
MVLQKEALEILNREREYEDKIASDLFNYILSNFAEIDSITEQERREVKKILRKIGNESLEHSRMFTELIEFCVKNGESNY